MTSAREEIQFTAVGDTEERTAAVGHQVYQGSRHTGMTRTQLTLIVVGVVTVVAVVLVAFSFKGVHYYEYGFMRRLSTGTVDLTHVYDTGCYTTGPDYDFKIFDASAHFTEFDDITVFVADRLEVHISANMQYFLRKHQLDYLHRQFDVHYAPIMKKDAKDAIKSAATAFTTRQFIHERLRIEKALFDAVKLRLGGRCCELNCEQTASCMPECLPYEQCTEDDWGSFADVRYFQLHDLTIPRDLSERYTQALVLQEADEREHFLQEAQIVRKETERTVAAIENKALQIDEYATSQSALVRAQATANATLTVENARSAGLRMLYEQLGIRDGEHMASFDYLRTIKRMTGAHIAVNYNTLISGAALNPDQLH